MTCARTAQDVWSKQGVSPPARMRGQLSAGHQRVKFIWRVTHASSSVHPATSSSSSIVGVGSMMNMRMSLLCCSRHLLACNMYCQVVCWVGSNGKSRGNLAVRFLTLLSHIERLGLHPTVQHIRHCVVCYQRWRDHRCLFVWIFCCGLSSSPNVWLRPTYHVWLWDHGQHPQLRERDDHLLSKSSIFFATCAENCTVSFEHLKCKEIPLAIEPILQWI